MVSALLLGLTLLLSGCATIMNNQTIDVPLKSDREGTTAIIAGETHTLPTVIQFDRHTGDKHLTLETEGYPSVPLLLESTVSGLVFGNIVSFGLIGLLLDLTNPGGYTLDPEQINYSFAKGKNLPRYGEPINENQETVDDVWE